jgi:uncharacterized membrane protein
MPWDIRKGHGGRARSLAKAISWRIVGTIDTFVWSLLITKHAVAAGSIATAEVFTKIVVFYLHERLWRLILWAPNAHLRSLIKAVSWRFVGSIDTFILTMIFTHRLKYAISIATAEALTKIVLFYLHERAWRRVRWERLEEPAAAPSAVRATGEAVS